MNNRNQVEEAHRLISTAIIMSGGGLVASPEGPVALWVANDTVLYLEAMLNYGSWQNAGLSAPKIEIQIMASRYGVRL